MTRLRDLELAVVQAAMRAAEDGAPMPVYLYEAVKRAWLDCPQCNAGGHTCPGDGKDIAHGATDCGEHAVEAEQELIWVPRTWTDVRTGDDVRLPGTDATAHVEHAVRQRWNVDSRTGTASWNPPQPLEWSGVKVTLRTTANPDQPAELVMDPAKPIEIKLTQGEADAIELLGWDNRTELITESGK
jgi:hypothetical protein